MYADIAALDSAFIQQMKIPPDTYFDMYKNFATVVASDQLSILIINPENG